MSLKATLQGNYISKAGMPMFVYTVVGKADEIQAYKDAQGANLRTNVETGEILWFRAGRDAQGVRRLPKKSVELLITTNNRVVENTLDDELRLAAKVEDNLAVEIAKAQAQQYAVPQARTVAATAPKAAQPAAAPAVTAGEALEQLVNSTPEGTESISE